MADGLHTRLLEHWMGRIAAAVGDASQVERAPGDSHYVWTFPGAPVTVKLSLAAAEDIARRVIENPRACGLLLGRAVAPVTEVSALKPLGSSAGEIETELAAVAHLTAEPYLVGFYRAHSEEPLRLNAEDYALAERWFAAPHCVFLLVRPESNGAPVASFFFRDENGMNGEFAFLEFPLDDSLRSVPARAAPRLQPAPVKPAVELGAETPKPRRRRGKRAAWAMVAIALGLCVGYAAFRYEPWKLDWRSALSLPAPQPKRGFGLRAERQNGDLKLLWDRDTAIIGGAVSGSLSIQDGDSIREIQLDGEQLRSGSVLYQPVNGEVRMRLSVVGQAGALSENVVVILPRNGTPVVQSLPPAAIAQPLRAERQPEHVVPSRSFSFPRATPAPKEAIVEPPPLVTPSPAAASASAILGPSPPLLRVAPVAPTPAPNRISTYKPPALAQQVIPTVSTYLRSMLVSAQTVEVLVNLDERGRVLDAVARRNPNVQPLMLRACELAARQSRYRPASDGGKAIPGEILLRYVFTPGR